MKRTFSPFELTVVFLLVALCRVLAIDESKSPTKREDSGANGATAAAKADQPPATKPQQIRQKLVSLVAENALELPPANVPAAARNREELVGAVAEAETRKNDAAGVIRATLELLTRFEPAEDFSNRLWRAAFAIDWWQRANGSDNMARLLDGVLDVCGQMPANDEANIEGAFVKVAVLTRHKKLDEAGAILTELRERPGLAPAYRAAAIARLGDNAAARRDYDAALSTWEGLDDFSEFPSSVQPLLSAVFIHLARGKRADAFRVLNVLRGVKPETVKASPVAVQVNELLALSRDPTKANAFWDSTAQWWPDWQAVDQKLGAPLPPGEEVIPLIPNLQQLGAAAGRAAQLNDSAGRAQSLRLLAHAARWEPSMLVELTELSVSLPALQLHAVVPEYRRMVISVFEHSLVEDPALRRPLYCMAAAAYIDSQLGQKALDVVHEFYRFPAADDNMAQIMSRLWALAALGAGREIEPAAAAAEKALESKSYVNYRAQGVTLLAQLYERMREEKRAIDVLEREIEHPAIQRDAAGLASLKTRLESLRSAGSISMHLAAVTKAWIAEIRIPWFDYARPKSLTDPSIGDLDQILSFASTGLMSPEVMKLAALVAEDDTQPEARRVQALWTLGIQTCALAPDSQTAIRWARSFLDSDQLPARARSMFLSGCALRAFLEDDAELFDSLAAHPVRKALEEKREEVMRLSARYFAATNAGSDECVRFAQELLRQPLGGNARDVFHRIVARLVSFGEMDKARTLIQAFGAIPPALDPENKKAAGQLAMLRAISRAQKWQPVNQAMREIVLAHFGKDAPASTRPAPTSDLRLAALNLPAAEATQARLQWIRAGKFPENCQPFWIQFMRDLPANAEVLALRSRAFRAALESAQEDGIRADAIMVVMSAIDMDSPEERAATAEILKPYRHAESQSRTADMLRAYDLQVALMTGASADGRSALGRIRDESLKTEASSAVLAAALAAENELVARSVLDSIGPQVLLDGKWIGLSLSAYRFLGMKEEASLAEQNAPGAIYRLMMEFCVSGDLDACAGAYRIADLLGDASLIPRDMAERVIRSRRHALTRLSMEADDAAFHHEWERTAKACEEAMRDYPTFYHFHFLHGRAMAELNRPEEALRSMRSYVSIVHDEPEVREAKALIKKLSEIGNAPKPP